MPRKSWYSDALRVPPAQVASMRPGRVCPGKAGSVCAVTVADVTSRFNEAGASVPRKRVPVDRRDRSGRPGCFNEAGASDAPEKLRNRATESPMADVPEASMRPGRVCPGKGSPGRSPRTADPR